MLEDPDEWELAARKIPGSRHLAREWRELLKDRKRPTAASDPEGAA